MYCIKCGREIPEGSKFCVYCGAVQIIHNNPVPDEATDPESILPAKIPEDSTVNNAEGALIQKASESEKQIDSVADSFSEPARQQSTEIPEPIRDNNTDNISAPKDSDSQRFAGKDDGTAGRNDRVASVDSQSNKKMYIGGAIVLLIIAIIFAVNMDRNNSSSSNYISYLENSNDLGSSLKNISLPLKSSDVAFEGVTEYGYIVFDLKEDIQTPDGFKFSQYDSHYLQVEKNGEYIGGLSIYTINSSGENVSNRLKNNDEIIVQLEPDYEFQDYLYANECGLDCDLYNMTVTGLTEYFVNASDITQDDIDYLYEKLKMSGLTAKSIYILEPKNNGDRLMVGFAINQSGNYLYVYKNLFRDKNGNFYSNEYDEVTINKDKEEDISKAFNDNYRVITVSSTNYGYVTVLVTNLNIRSSPSTSASKKGYAKMDYPYEILDIVENEGYTWYKIGENEYIASKEGSWTRRGE